MSRDPSGDVTGGDGLSGYEGNPDLRTPALGRSSRDLAANTGPAGAPQGLFSTGDKDDTSTGHARDPVPDPEGEAGTRQAKRHPEIPPDARLGLHPVLPGDAAPHHPGTPPTERGVRVFQGFIAGGIGAAVAIALMYAIYWGGLVSAPAFARASQQWIGADNAPLAHALGVVAFLVVAEMCGGMFGLLVARPTVPKGMLFGLLLAIFQWLVLATALGREVLSTQIVVLSLLLNVLIWGAIVGALCHRWQRAPRTAAVE